jgi:hypothetical protein
MLIVKNSIFKYSKLKFDSTLPSFLLLRNIRLELTKVCKFKMILKKI